MAVYRAKRNVSFPDGIWRQNTDRDIDPGDYADLIAAGRIVEVGTATVEVVEEAATGTRFDEPSDGDLGNQEWGDGTEAQDDLVPDDAQDAAGDDDDDPAPTRPVAPVLAADGDTGAAQDVDE